jgi:redox-sensitive bicupin YhaK (pirin superfamily)
MQSPKTLSLRSVARIVESARTMEGEGFEVRRPFPTRVLDHLDPFLLLDEMGPADHPPGAAKGAPPHPHRGFETVTYLLAGEFEHQDSAGHQGHLRAGDVQWMTAGSGLVHSEMPSTELRSQGGRLHGFQLWVNLPRRDKMMPPRYQEIPQSKIPSAATDDGRVAVKVIAGEALGTKAVIDTRTPIIYLHCTIQPGGELVQPVPRDWSTCVYVFRGAGRFGREGRAASEGHLVILGPDGDAVVLGGQPEHDQPAEVLLLAGEPLGEPIARYGPFVMNSPEEIQQALDDFRAGRMGKI